MTTPITPLQNTNYQYSSTSTQFSSNGGVQCGLSVGSNIGNSNTNLQQTYSLDIRYNTNPCPDYKAQSEEETKRVNINTQSTNINNCIMARRDLALQGKDPNLACPPIKW